MGSGIQFCRTDLPGKPILKVDSNSVLKTDRTTTIGTKEFYISTVEHFFAVLFAYGLKDLFIEIDGPEIPIGDGSCLHFIEAFEKAGIKENAKQKFRPLKNGIFVSKGDQKIIAAPSDSLSITYILNYPKHPLLSLQMSEYVFSKESFIREIAPCRTFAKLEEVELMKKLGLLKSDSLDYGIVIDQDKILNPQGLRFENEMARHKVLDFLGDLFLAQVDVNMHVQALRSGHQLNVEFSQKLNQNQ